MGISNVKKIYVESDFYIPVKIRFEHWNAMTEPRHCWGISKLDGNFLFEIAIGEQTGELKYITLAAEVLPKFIWEHLCSQSSVQKIK